MFNSRRPLRSDHLGEGLLFKQRFESNDTPMIPSTRMQGLSPSFRGRELIIVYGNFRIGEELDGADLCVFWVQQRRCCEMENSGAEKGDSC